MRYIGLDIHKNHIQACVRSGKGKILLDERFKTDAREIKKFFSKIEGHGPLSTAMKATGFYFWIYDCIAARGHEVKVVHPARIKPLVKAKSKNDRNDASMLAELLRTGCLDGIYVPSEGVRDMRDLTRHTESLVRKKGDIKKEMVAALDQRDIKMPAEFRTNFTKKHMAWMRSLEILTVDEKLDLLELTMAKIENVEQKIERG